MKANQGTTLVHIGAIPFKSTNLGMQVRSRELTNGPGLAEGTVRHRDQYPLIKEYSLNHLGVLAFQGSSGATTDSHVLAHVCLQGKMTFALSTAEHDKASGGVCLDTAPTQQQLESSYGMIVYNVNPNPVAGWWQCPTYSA